MPLATLCCACVRANVDNLDEWRVRREAELSAVLSGGVGLWPTPRQPIAPTYTSVHRQRALARPTGKTERHAGVIARGVCSTAHSEPNCPHLAVSRSTLRIFDSELDVLDSHSPALLSDSIVNAVCDNSARMALGVGAKANTSDGIDHLPVDRLGCVARPRKSNFFSQDTS